MNGLTVEPRGVHFGPTSKPVHGTELDDEGSTCNGNHRRSRGLSRFLPPTINGPVMTKWQKDAPEQHHPENRVP